MKPAATDPFPDEIEIVRRRRRTIELSLENGHLVARVPQRLSTAELTAVLEDLRQRLWVRLQREHVFDDSALERRAERVRRRYLDDCILPAHRVRFSNRQRKRWGSCVFDGQVGRVWISSRLRGHRNWLLDHILLHELAHLLFSDHGPRFTSLIKRSPDHERGRGYLEALETIEQFGPTARILEEIELVPMALAPADDRPTDSLPLFSGLGPEPAPSERLQL